MFNLKNIFLIVLLIISNVICCQTTHYVFTISKTNVYCSKGAAGIQIDSLKTNDTLTITWSNGQTGVTSIGNLNEGDYNVHVVIKNKKDTTLNFKIDKEECPVVISNHFTPNADNYNDTWQISNTPSYPNLEIVVFNKWGQQIHIQKGTYTPWDGTWNGLKVPDGTYYYVFYFEQGKNKTLKGDVTILR